MNTTMTKILLMLITTGLCFSVVISSIACTDQIVRNNQEYTKKQEGLGYKVTLHEYILLKYFKSYNFDHYESIILEHRDQFVIGDTFDPESATSFIIDNFHLFADSLLYKSILLDGLAGFNIEIDCEELPIAFTESLNRKFLDYEGLYGGINMLQFSHTEQVETLELYVQDSNDFFSDDENRHFTNMLILINNQEPLENIIEYLKHQDTSKFSDTYIDVVDFAINTFSFYLKDSPFNELPQTNSIVVGAAAVGFVAGYDIAAYRHARRHGLSVGGSTAYSGSCSGTMSVLPIVSSVISDIFKEFEYDNTFKYRELL